jgi:hypothetical protein
LTKNIKDALLSRIAPCGRDPEEGKVKSQNPAASQSGVFLWPQAAQKLAFAACGHKKTHPLFADGFWDLSG